MEEEGGDDPPRVEGEGSADVGQDSRRNARLGLLLFGIYVLLYGGFVYLNAFHPASMEAVPFAGLNLAVLYGMGLIASAMALALLYTWLCRGGSR